jgi:hypothetical protein
MDITTQRLGLFRSGYAPIPTIGKIPPFQGWQENLNSNADEIRLWGKTFHHAQNTGILTASTPALDIDIRNPEAAEAVEILVREQLGDREGSFLVRFGAAPKRAILFQTDKPFRKIQASLTAPDGSTDQKIEFLGDGQQIVAFGIHPTTNKPYRWHPYRPGAGDTEQEGVPRDALPYIDEQEARALLNAAVELLVNEYGYTIRAKTNGASNGHATEDAFPREWDENIKNIGTGRELHDSITSLAMKMVKSGMSDGAAVNFIRGLMRASTAPRDERWQDRYNDIPRAVTTARAKQTDTGKQTDTWEAPDSPQPYTFPDPAKIPPREFLYGKQYLRASVSATIAAGGKGKSTLKLTEAIGMAVGRNIVPGERLKAPLRVWVVNAEEDQNELNRRIAAICQRYGVDPAECADRLFVTSIKGKPWCIATLVKNVPTLNQPLIDWLIAEIKAKNIDVLMLDPLVSFHRVSENSNEHMDIVIKDGLGAISDATNAAITFAHHTGKSKLGQSEASVEDSRGASSIIWATRVNRVLNGMTTKDAGALGITEIDRWRYIRVTGGKSNPAPPEKAVWLKLEAENLANGDEVAVVTPWVPPDPLATAAGDVAYKVRELARTGEYRADRRSAKWIGFAVANLLGLPLAYGADNKPEDVAQAKRAIKMWISSKTLALERRKDGNFHERTFVVPGPWNEQPPAAAEPDFELSETDGELSGTDGRKKCVEPLVPSVRQFSSPL